MSAKESVKLPPRILVDADVFFSYLVGDDLSQHSAKLIGQAGQGLTKFTIASELYDDMITALRSDNVPIDVVIEIIADLKKLPHEVLPTTVDIAQEAMRLYSRYGGSRRLHYFDSFHAATAKEHDLMLVTSDRYILHNSESLGVKVLDLRKI